MKDTGWLKEEVTEILLTSKKDGTNYFYYRDLKEKIYNAIDQLDEPVERKEEIICPYCNEEQQYQGGSQHLKVFLSRGNHRLECYQCGEFFQVNTETRYVYEVEKKEEWTYEQDRVSNQDE